MELKLVSLLIIGCLVGIQAKIVYLNGTEIFNGKLRSINMTVPPQKWISVFNPRNISNHSGSNSKPVTDSVIRKNDAEEEVQVEVEEEIGDEDKSPQNGMITRDTTLLSSIRGIWSDLSPILTVLSTLIGIFLMFVIIESPLSPLPVPPLPYSPVGPYPPTNMYPFGIPPPRNHYGVGYIGPQNHASYRIPRRMKLLNDTFDDAVDIVEKGLKNLNANTGEQKDVLATIKGMWPSVMDQAVQVLMNHIGRFTTDDLRYHRKELRQMAREPE